jgi:hypothetical protein
MPPAAYGAVNTTTFKEYLMSRIPSFLYVLHSLVVTNTLEMACYFPVLLALAT